MARGTERRKPGTGPTAGTHETTGIQEQCRVQIRACHTTAAAERGKTAGQRTGISLRPRNTSGSIPTPTAHATSADKRQRAGADGKQQPETGKNTVAQQQLQPPQLYTDHRQPGVKASGGRQDSRPDRQTKGNTPTSAVTACPATSGQNHRTDQERQTVDRQKKQL